MKRVLLTVCILSMLMLCGCGDRQCSMQVHTEYKGSSWGREYDDEYDYTIDVSEGNIICENDRRLEKIGPEDADFKVFEIKDIGARSVTLLTEDGELEIAYGETYSPDPFIVYDAPSPRHDIVFHKQ